MWCNFRQQNATTTLLLPCSSILNGKLTEFTINTKEILDHSSDDDDEDNEEYDDSRNISMDNKLDLPFTQIKGDMTMIHYGLYKRILTEGSGPIVPDTAQVTVDYSGFWEGDSTPFESTWIGRKPLTTVLGENMLPGLYYALLSMKKGEVAKFIIPYQHLYGVLGHELAGIPQKADGLYIIRMIAFEDIGDSAAINEETIDSYESYEKVLERVAEVRKSARANFVERDYEKAVKDYQNCITALKFCHGAVAAERLLILRELYVNVCVCYHKMDRHLDVIKMHDDLMACGPNNCKALFQLGRAYYKQGEYDKAVEYLARAQKLEPNNREVVQELRIVNEANDNYKKNIKEISKKAFNTTQVVAQPKKAEAKNCIYSMYDEYIRGFVNDPERSEEPMPLNMPKDEIAMIREIADKHQLTVSQNKENGEVVVRLLKSK